VGVGVGVGVGLGVGVGGGVGVGAEPLDSYAPMSQPPVWPLALPHPYQNYTAHLERLQ
jgi:hypothetical protein